MEIDLRLRELLWNHDGFVFAHTPKTGGTSVYAAMFDKAGWFNLSSVTISNLAVSASLREKFESTLGQLRSVVESGRPWILYAGHQSFGNRWHLDLPPRATVLITHRPTAARLQSWIGYYSKLIDWAEEASFNVLQNGTIRHFCATKSFPGFTGTPQWRTEHEWIGDAESEEVFISLIRKKLLGQRMRHGLQTDLKSVLAEMTSGHNFYYRDLFPTEFTRTKTFSDRTVVIPLEHLATYFESVFGVCLSRYNTSTDVDIRNLTNLDVEQFRQIIEQFAKPDRATEAILLKHQWEG